MNTVVPLRPVALIDHPAPSVGDAGRRAERRPYAGAHNDHTWYALPSREFLASTRSNLIAELCDTGPCNPHPGRVYSFNVAEGWARDETEDVAREIANYYGHEGSEPSFELRSWLHQILGPLTADEILGTVED